MSPAGAPARVELLWWAGCPSWPRALDELRAAMSRAGRSPEDIAMLEVTSEEQARGLGFVGSPTIRIAGTDVFPPGDEPTGLTCRIYRRRGGRVSPLPDPADLDDALNATTRPQRLEAAHDA